MITFETQEDFEDAVMAVLRSRLYLSSEKSRDYGYRGNIEETIELSLKDIKSQFDSTSITETYL